MTNWLVHHDAFHLEQTLGADVLLAIENPVGVRVGLDGS